MEGKEVFQRVSDTMLSAVMFHADMMECYRFLGLRGFMRFHECRMKEELCGRTKLRDYYTKHHLELLPDDHTKVARREVIPKDWYKYQSTDVTKAIARQAVQRTMQEYVAWEGYAKKTYQDASKELQDLGWIVDGDYMACVACGTARELAKAEKLMIQFNLVDYDMDYIMEIQRPLHDEYKKKMRDKKKKK